MTAETANLGAEEVSATEKRLGVPPSSAVTNSKTVQGLSRRGMLALLGAGAAGLAVGGTVGVSAAQIAATGSGSKIYPFYGAHQSGIVTAAQDRMHFAAFDLAPDITRQDLIELLQDWTYAASRLTQGLEMTVKGAFDGGSLHPPDDTGEAADISPAGLTITFGFGSSIFRATDGTDRFGLAALLPTHFTQLGKMRNDFMRPERSGGDLCIQACADDPQVAVHAIRNLSRIAFGRAQIRWSQLGFGRTAATTRSQKTPRNLFGFKDGTANLRAEDTAELDEHVWISAEQGPAWAVGGTYLIARRINMTIEVWDGLQLGEQERVVGRTKKEGAPLSGGTEFTAPDFTKVDVAGEAVIDSRSHVFRTHPSNNDGIKMLRRGYNFVDGNDAQGKLDAGLFFIAFVNSPERFARVHKNMARDDLFVEYLKTTGSAVFLVPPGVQDGQYIGQQLFEL